MFFSDNGNKCAESEYGEKGISPFIHSMSPSYIGVLHGD